MIGEVELSPEFLTIEPGDWVEWLMPNFLRHGEVLEREGHSLLILFQGHSEPTAVPLAEQYFHDSWPDQRMRRINPETRVNAPEGDSMSVKQAAAILGTTPKGVRRLLRSGELQGSQREGRWVAVLADSLKQDRPETPDMG